MARPWSAAETAGGGYNIQVVDAQFNGTTVRIMDGSLDISAVQQDKWYDVTGILGQYTSYQVIPHKASDVVLSADQPPLYPTEPGDYEATVARVVDGDTIALQSPVFGATNVRFLNIDTPESDAYINLVATPQQSLGITEGVASVAMHAGSTLAIVDPAKAKGLVYVPVNVPAWANAVDSGVYSGGGRAEDPFAAIAKVGAGKAAFIGDCSPVEDATPKYLRDLDQLGALLVLSESKGWISSHGTAQRLQSQLKNAQKANKGQIRDKKLDDLAQAIARNSGKTIDSAFASLLLNDLNFIRTTGV